MILTTTEDRGKLGEGMLRSLEMCGMGTYEVWSSNNANADAMLLVLQIRNHILLHFIPDQDPYFLCYSAKQSKPPFSSSQRPPHPSLIPLDHSLG